MDLSHLFKTIENLKKEKEGIYIYGFGSYGRNLYQILKRNHILVNGFLVTNMSDEMDKYEIPVYESRYFLNKDIGYILALNEKNKKEVKCFLEKNGVDKKSIINAGTYLEKFGEKRGTNAGSIEITTVIGCKINCKHCPQSLLLKNYFNGNTQRTSMMSLETFRRCLDFFPAEYDISFGGMSEPFLNDQCVEMLKIACDRGKRISLYTTLIGIKPERVEEILKMPLQFVVLHVADQYGYACIDTNELYYRMLEQFVNAKKLDGSSFVNMCNAQAEPDERVKVICQGKYEVLTEMTDRAGNLEDDHLIHNKIKEGKLSCGNLGKEMNNNILLPDGSVVLCCMDFGLQHVLGNIYENSFEEIMNGFEMRRVQAGLNGDTNIDILCRKCSYAKVRK